MKTCRDEDHLALFMELLGKMPRRAMVGQHVREFFNRQGELRHIKKLRFWPLEAVLIEKYELPESEVDLRPPCLPCPWGGSQSDLDGSKQSIR